MNEGRSRAWHRTAVGPLPAPTGRRFAVVTVIVTDRSVVMHFRIDVLTLAGVVLLIVLTLGFHLGWFGGSA